MFNVFISELKRERIMSYSKVIVCLIALISSTAHGNDSDPPRKVPVPSRNKYFSPDARSFDKKLKELGIFQENEPVKSEEIPVSILQKVSEIDDISKFMSDFLSYNSSKKGLGISILNGKDEGDIGIGGTIGRGTIRDKNKLTQAFTPGTIAQQASCKPSPTVVELKKVNNPLILYYPTCTRVNRCGGCCRSNLLTCEPSKKKTVNLNVIKAKYSSIQNKPFNFEALESIPVEEHTECKCQCKVKERDCNALQTYQSNECRCVCKNQDKAKKCQGTDRFWDSTQCACKCKNFQDQCSTGRTFSERICRCVPSQFLKQVGTSEWNFGRSAVRRVPN